MMRGECLDLLTYLIQVITFMTNDLFRIGQTT